MLVLITEIHKLIHSKMKSNIMVQHFLKIHLTLHFDELYMHGLLCEHTSPFSEIICVRVRPMVDAVEKHDQGKPQNGPH